MVLACFSLFSACATPPAQESQKSSQITAKRYEVVTPGTHPGLLFCAKELSRLRRRAKGEGLAAECYGKVVDSRLARLMSFWARWGSTCDKPFRAEPFLEQHPQYDWLRGYMDDRPTRNWTIFEKGK